MYIYINVNNIFTLIALSNIAQLPPVAEFMAHVGKKCQRAAGGCSQRGHGGCWWQGLGRSPTHRWKSLAFLVRSRPRGRKVVKNCQLVCQPRMSVLNGKLYLQWRADLAFWATEVPWGNSKATCFWYLLVFNSCLFSQWVKARLQIFGE